MMNARSEAYLINVMPELADAVHKAAASLQAQGTTITVVAGLRTSMDQQILYSQGRSKPGHIVTNARPGESMHNYGLAVDVVPYLSGQFGDLNWNVKTAQFQAMVAAMKAEGLEWGGDWKGDLGDFDHFQLAGLPATPTPAMVQDFTATAVPYASATISGIWDKVRAGEYAV